LERMLGAGSEGSKKPFGSGGPKSALIRCPYLRRDT
jgi:hypothetical protein